jgi:hypothetical protein
MRDLSCTECAPICVRVCARISWHCCTVFYTTAVAFQQQKGQWAALCG